MPTAEWIIGNKIISRRYLLYVDKYAFYDRRKTLSLGMYRFLRTGFERTPRVGNVENRAPEGQPCDRSVQSETAMKPDLHDVREREVGHEHSSEDQPIQGRQWHESKRPGKR